jgi:menaquinone-dependent protoporphyrinogen oxidase
MSRILVIYASHDGQAAAIARRITRVLANRHSATVLAVGDPAIGATLAECDTVVIGASVRYGQHSRRIERLVRDNLGLLWTRRSAFFSVSMSAARPGPGRQEAGRYIDKFVERTGWWPERTVAFAGALRFTRYNFVLRAVMRMISRSVGGDTDTSRDYEYTDWAAVDRFAAQVAGDAHLAAGALDAPQGARAAAH